MFNLLRSEQKPFLLSHPASSVFSPEFAATGLLFTVSQPADELIRIKQQQSSGGTLSAPTYLLLGLPNQSVNPLAGRSGGLERKQAKFRELSEVCKDRQDPGFQHTSSTCISALCCRAA